MSKFIVTAKDKHKGNKRQTISIPLSKRDAEEMVNSIEQQNKDAIPKYRILTDFKIDPVNENIMENNIKEIIKQVIAEESDYQEFFKQALEKAGKSIPEMSDEEKREFFNKVSTAWDNKKSKTESKKKKKKNCETCPDLNESKNNNKTKHYSSLDDFEKDANIGDIFYLGNKSQFDRATKKDFFTVKGRESDGSLIISKGKSPKKHIIGADRYDDEVFVFESINESKREISIEKVKVGDWVYDNIGVTWPVKKIKKQKQDGKDYIILHGPTNKAVYKRKSGTKVKIEENTINEEISVVTERPYRKGKGTIIMMDGGKGIISAIFRDKKNANKFNRNNPEDVKKLYLLAKKTPYPKAIDESKYDQWHNTRIQSKNIFRMLKKKHNNDIPKMKDGLEDILRQNNTKEDQAEVVRQEFNKYFNVKENSLNERDVKRELQDIKKAVEAASSFMNVGKELKKQGIKYDFSTSPLPIYILKQGGKRVAIVNKNNVEDPDVVVGDIAIGLMENDINEAKTIDSKKLKWDKNPKGEYIPNVHVNDYIKVDGKKYRVKSIWASGDITIVDDSKNYKTINRNTKDINEAVSELDEMTRFFKKIK